MASPLGDLAFNNHGLGISPESLLASPAGKEVNILSIDKDRLGKAFVSTIEGKRFPYYGTQWHPEKAPWEWNPEHAIAHSQVRRIVQTVLSLLACTAQIVLFCVLVQH